MQGVEGGLTRGGAARLDRSRDRHERAKHCDAGGRSRDLSFFAEGFLDPIAHQAREEPSKEACAFGFLTNHVVQLVAVGGVHARSAAMLTG